MWLEQDLAALAAAVKTGSREAAQAHAALAQWRAQWQRVRARGMR